jgi:hypothetical protein
VTSWAFDLVAADDAVRHGALHRHQSLLAAASEALSRYNALWPHRTPEMDREWAEFRRLRAQTVFGPVGEFVESRTQARFAVLYLRWEAAYPGEWGAPGSWMWSPWTTKEIVLRTLMRGGVPAEVRSPVTDLIVEALRRPYRCKDWMYAGLVRHVADPPFLSRIEALRNDGDRRAQFLLDVAANPARPVKRTTWQRWLERQRIG